MAIRHGDETSGGQNARLRGDEHHIDDATITRAMLAEDARAGNTYGIVVSNNGTKTEGSAELTVAKTSTGIYQVSHPFGAVVAVAAPAVAGRVLYLIPGTGMVTVAVVDHIALDFADGGFHLLLTVI